MASTFNTIVPLGKTSVHVNTNENFKENLTAEEYARRQGVQPVSDFSVLFGAGNAEDWDGFDKAIERWREENKLK